MQSMRHGSLSVSFDTHIPGIGVVTLGEGGLVTKPTLAMIGESGPEMVVPVSGTSVTSASVQPLSSASAQSQTGGDFNFNVTIQNATLTSTKDAQKVGLQIAYSAQRELSRSGYSRGS